VQRLEQLETQERNARDALTKALGELAGQQSSAMQLSEQLSKLVTHYRSMKAETSVIRTSLDKALKSNAMFAEESASSSDKLRAVVNEFRRAQEEVTALRSTLDKALKDIDATVEENANISDKLRQLLTEYRKMTENELQLRDALKRQHGSLNAAYHRVKDVELELTRAKAAGIEERETLVDVALRALQQLRTRLGYVHALRQDATKPVEEALVVRKASGEDALVVKKLLQQSASVPSIASVLPASPDMRGNARLEAFMERVADTVGVSIGTIDSIGATHRTFPPVSPYWSVNSSRPTPDTPSGGRYRELSPVAMPRVPKPGSCKSLSQQYDALPRAGTGESLGSVRSTDRLSLLYGPPRSPLPPSSPSP